jgi:hypothetical protein
MIRSLGVNRFPPRVFLSCMALAIVGALVLAALADRADRRGGARRNRGKRRPRWADRVAVRKPGSVCLVAT